MKNLLLFISLFFLFSCTEKQPIDLNKTFELATWWKDSVKFQKMILDYDTYNLNDQLNVQIIVIMPEFKDIDYTTTYDNEIETRFNNFVQSTDELIECLKN